MPKLPRAEVSTVAFNPTPQPFSTGDGYSAPGRAMQGLGQAISQAGAQFQDALSKEDEFQDKLNVLKFTNEQDELATKSRLEFQRENPDGYATEQTGSYKQSAEQFMPTLKTARGRQTAALAFERQRSNLYETDVKFEHGKRSEKVGSQLDATINGQISQPWGSEDLSAVPDEMFGRLQDIDAIIKAAPLQNKKKYEEQAAKLVFDKMRAAYAAAKKLEDFDPAWRKLQERLGQTGAALNQGKPNAGPLPPVSQQFFDRAPTKDERRKIAASGGVVVNLDTNWAPSDQQTTPMVVIPDNATAEQRSAAEAYARGVADVYKTQFGKSLEPKVVTRSQNGRGRNDTIHTEPFSVNDSKAVKFFTSPEGKAAHAQLLRDTFGKVPGAQFSIPHDPTGARKDRGAKGPMGDEVEIAQQVLAELRGGGNDPKLTQQPTLVKRDGTAVAGVQVADASGAIPASAVPAGATNRLPAAPGATPRAAVGVMNETLQYGLQRSDTWARENAGLQEVWAKKRAAKIGQMIDLSDKGYDVPDNDIQALKREIATKPELDQKFGLSANLAGVEQAAQAAKQLRQYTPTRLAADIEKADALLRDGAASGALSTEQVAAAVKRKERMDSLLKTMRTELEKDPLSWVERAKIDLPVVPGSDNKAPIALERISPGDPELANKLEVRLDQAERVAAYYQAPLKVFTAVEREAFSNAIKSMGPKALPLLGQMAKSLGPNAVSVINEIMPKEPELARAGYLIASGGDSQAAQDIFATFQRRQDRNYKAVPSFKGNEERNAFADVVGDLYDRLPSALSAGQEADSVMRSAQSIYEARNKNGTPDKTKFQEAIKLALGERTVNGSTYGGVVSLDAPGWFTGSYKVQVPSTIKQDQFLPMVSGISAAQLKEAGVALPVDAKGPMRGTIDLGSMIVERQIVQIGPGKYAFAKGDGSGQIKTNPQFMVGEDGKTFVLDIAKMMPTLKKSAGSSGWILD
jgi:hypothetical protein